MGDEEKRKRKKGRGRREKWARLRKGEKKRSEGKTDGGLGLLVGGKKAKGKKRKRRRGKRKGRRKKPWVGLGLNGKKGKKKEVGCVGLKWDWV